MSVICIFILIFTGFCCCWWVGFVCQLLWWAFCVSLHNKGRVSEDISAEVSKLNSCPCSLFLLLQNHWDTNHDKRTKIAWFTLHGRQAGINRNHCQFLYRCFSFFLFLFLYYWKEHSNLGEKIYEICYKITNFITLFLFIAFSLFWDGRIENHWNIHHMSLYSYFFSKTKNTN